MRVVVCVLAAVLASSDLALAEIKSSTKYTYFTVTGNTAPDIFQSLSARGPRVKGVHAYGSTSATTSQNGTLVLSNQSCRIKDYSFNAKFVIRIPRHRNEALLKGKTRNNWQKFANFVKVHEEQHRSIWLNCATRLQQQIRSIQAKNCNAAERQADKIMKSTLASCQKQHAALDARDQRAMLKHPFVKQLIGSLR